jgi:hypothetical protein
LYIAYFISGWILFAPFTNYFSFLPSCLSSFLSSFLPSFLPFFFPSFLHSLPSQFVDGWLGIMVGNSLWYGLFDAAAVSPTAVAIKALVGSGAPLVTDRSTVVKWDLQQQQEQQQLSPQKQQVLEARSRSRLALSSPMSWEEAAWALLRDRANAADPAALSAHLAERGIGEGGELLQCTADELTDIAAFLHKKPRNFLLMKVAKP